MKFREPKEDDQQKIEEAYQLLIKLIRKHQGDIDPSLWAGAMIRALAINY